MDASVLMDRADRLKDWPNKKDSDIAAEIFDSYGLTPQVTDTEVIHDENVSTIIQRETDIQFLKRLALRNGFECYVDGDTGYFRPTALDPTPQPVLAVQFGDDTTVNRLLPRGRRARHRRTWRCPRSTRSPATCSTRRATPGQPASARRQRRRRLSRRRDGRRGWSASARRSTTGSAEMAALCQGLYDQGEWFVTGEGEVAANQYGTVLTPRATVTIKGIGETHSGVYYVTTSPTCSPPTATPSVQVKRNALMPTGNEKFASAATRLLAAVAGGV